MGIPDSVVLITGCPLDKSASSSVASCPSVHKHGIMKDNAPSTADEMMGKAGAGRELQGVQQDMSLAPSGVCDYESGMASLGRTDSTCSSNRPNESPFLTQHKRLFKQLQKLRVYFLADLWDILERFKDHLKVHAHDVPVKNIIHYHIDILQRMIAPMVAQRKMLASWLNEVTFDQLRKQIFQYLETFKGEKFESAFEKFVARHRQSTMLTLPAEAESEEPNCTLESSDDENIVCKDMETEAEVVTLSTSEGDREESILPAYSESAYAPRPPVYAVKKAALGVSVKEHDRSAEGVETSTTCFAEVHFGRPNKRLKKMSAQDLEFMQHAQQQVALQRANPVSGDQLSTASLDILSGSSGGQQASYQTRESQISVTVQPKDSETVDLGSSENVNRLLLGVPHSCTVDTPSQKNSGVVHCNDVDSGRSSLHSRSICSPRADEVVGVQDCNLAGGDFSEQHRHAERVSVQMFSGVLEAGKTRGFIYQPAHCGENLKMNGRQCCHSGVSRRCDSAGISWHVEDGGLHWRSCTGLSGGVIFPCLATVRDSGVKGGVFRCSEENVFVKLLFEYVEGKPYRGKSKDPSLMLNTFLLKRRRNQHSKPGDLGCSWFKGSSGDCMGNQRLNPPPPDDEQKEACRNVNQPLTIGQVKETKRSSCSKSGVKRKRSFIVQPFG